MRILWLLVPMLALCACGSADAPVVTRTPSTAASVVWGLITPVLDFGSVPVGQSALQAAVFRNDSSLSTVTLTSAQFSSKAFSVNGTPFPLNVAPGQQAQITVRFSPPAGGSYDGRADIGPTDAGGPVRLPIVASAPGGGNERVIDFGVQSFGGNLTPSLAVDLTANDVSLTLEALGPVGSTFGLGELLGPGGKVYENLSLTGDYIWMPGNEVFATTLPNTDRTNVQLVPGGGRYTFRMRRLTGGASTVQVRAIVESRPGGSNPDGVLDLNVWLADGISATAANAPTNTRLQDILSRIDQILSGRNIRLGDVHYYDIASVSYDTVSSEAEMRQMLQSSSAATATRANLFFVEVVLGSGVLGASATVSGPKRNGTTLSGVASVYSGFSSNVIGLIAAHELCHFLGLYHTVESNGLHDFIDDTPNCPARGTDGICTVEGAGLLMHWRANGGTDLTVSQAAVVRAHPFLRPMGSAVTKPVARSDVLTLEDWLQVASLAPHWCASCPAPSKASLPEGR